MVCFFSFLTFSIIFLNLSQFLSAAVDLLKRKIMESVFHRTSFFVSFEKKSEKQHFNKSPFLLGRRNLVTRIPLQTTFHLDSNFPINTAYTTKSIH